MELLPCPFCGGTSIDLSREYDTDGFGVYLKIQCHSCGAKTRDSFTSEECPQLFSELKDEWNKRQQPKIPRITSVDRLEDEGEYIYKGKYNCAVVTYLKSNNVFENDEGIETNAEEAVMQWQNIYGPIELEE